MRLNQNISLRDGFGNIYVFQSTSTNGPFPKVGGIYAFITETLDGVFVSYIGKSECLDERLMSHEKLPTSLSRFSTNAIATFQIASEAGRTSVERSLIELYRPPLNHQHNNALAKFSTFSSQPQTQNALAALSQTTAPKQTWNALAGPNPFSRHQ